MRRLLPRASLVHLATHGYFHPTLAMSSGVLLAPPADLAIERTDDDGAPQAWELGRTLPLSAQLVVLSACETGHGEKVRGDGLVGLTRAFQAAGARSVVATHWKVADVSTSELMVSFQKELREGVAKDMALKSAMAGAASIKETSHPFFWAHGDSHVNEVLASLVRGSPRGMQREAEEDDAVDAGQRRLGLRLRSHPPTKGLALPWKPPPPASRPNGSRPPVRGHPLHASGHRHRPQRLGRRISP